MFKTQVNILKLVRANNIKKINAFLQEMNYKFDLNFKVSGTTPLHEVNTFRMLCFILSTKIDIFLKNDDGKSALHVLKKKLKSFSKERAMLKMRHLNDAKLLDLESKVTEYSKIIRLLKTVNKMVFTKDIPSNNSLNSAIEMLSVINGEKAIDNQEVKNNFLDLVCFLSHLSLKKHEFNQKTKLYLNRDNFDATKIAQSALYITNNLSDLYHCSKEGVPYLLYHGATNPNIDEMLPLSHFGTLNAARDRLDNLEEAYKVKKDNRECFFHVKPVYLKMKNLFRIPDLGRHDINGYKSLLVHVLLHQKYGSQVINKLYRSFYTEHFSNVLSIYNVPKEYDFIFNQVNRMNCQEVERELSLGGIYAVSKSSDETTNYNENKEKLVYQRLIRFFERQGYDGFIYRNGCEDWGNDSFICFRPNQIQHASCNDKEILSKKVSPKNPRLDFIENEWLKSCVDIKIGKDESSKFSNFLFLELYGSILPYYLERRISKIKENFSKKISKLFLHFSERKRC